MKIKALIISLVILFTLTACDEDNLTNSTTMTNTESVETSSDYSSSLTSQTSNYTSTQTPSSSFDSSSNSQNPTSSNSSTSSSSSTSSQTSSSNSNSNSSKPSSSSSISEFEFGIDLLSIDGYAKDEVTSHDSFEKYITVSNEKEFLDAVILTPENERNNMVIEITNDLNLGYYELEQSMSITSYTSTTKLKKFGNIQYINDSYLKTCGISQIEFSKYDGLTVYSKTGITIKHAGFKLNSCKNIAFRNIKMDEMWEWEDTFLDGTTSLISKIGDYDRFGWAFFKINFCNGVWIDHCTFTRSFDGFIDSENGTTGVSITWCNFTSGDISEGSFIYNMMERVKTSYENNEGKYGYYKMLREKISHEEILHAICAPQKKGFMIGGGDTVDNDEWNSNKNLEFSICNTKIVGLEDRLPRIRGGNGYIFNVYLDCNDYYTYRTTVKSKISSSSGTYTFTYNGTSKTMDWKLALTSQGMVSTNGGSVKYENSIFEGVNTLIRSTSPSNSTEPYRGGFLVENCTWKKGSTNVTSFTSNDLSVAFKWNTLDGSAPFSPNLFETSDLKNILANSTYGVGSGIINWNYVNWLKNTY